MVIRVGMSHSVSVVKTEENGGMNKGKHYPWRWRCIVALHGHCHHSPHTHKMDARCIGCRTEKQTQIK